MITLIGWSVYAISQRAFSTRLLAVKEGLITWTSQPLELGASVQHLKRTNALASPIQTAESKSCVYEADLANILSQQY
jgi:hypothetical protein